MQIWSCNYGVTELKWSVLLLDPDVELGYAVRRYKKGDESSLVALFNNSFQEYAGFIPRTLEYWDWCCLQRPDVTDEGIITVCYKETIVGYAVVGKSGNVWEICYDKRFNSELVLTKMLTEALKYAHTAGADSVQFNFPKNDKFARKVGKKLGFAESPPDYMFISVLNLLELTRAMLGTSVNRQNVEGTFLFRVKNSQTPFISKFYIDVHNRKVEIINGEGSNPELVLDTNESTLISCMLGGTSILKAIMTSEIILHPFWKIRKSLKLLSLMKSNSPWFIPRADCG